MECPEERSIPWRMHKHNDKDLRLQLHASRCRTWYTVLTS